MPENTELREQLVSQGINAVIVVEETKSLAALECGAYGCSEHYSHGIGLFTRSFLGMDRYMVSASTSLTIEIIDEPIDLIAIETFWSSQRYNMRNREIEDFKDPMNFKDFKEKELRPIFGELMLYYEGIAKSFVRFINRPNNKNTEKL